jgi:lactoylglutathione lyase
MLTAVGTITVHVRNQDEALAYYTQKLGFEVRSDMPMGPGQRWLEVAPPGAKTRILLYKATAKQPGAISYKSALARIGKSTGLVMEVDDIVATFQQFREKGVTIVEEPTQQHFGWWGMFADQDGNSYGVHQ